MTRKFYDALQLDPSILKRRIAACETKKEKNFYRAAMAVRSALIVAFAILFISLLSGLFGADNTPMAVALFCMLLGIRFVNFEYCAGDSLAGLAAALAILTLAPCAAAQAGPALVAPLHFAAFALLYLALPAGLRPLLGPLGGFCMGFCTDYRYKTAMNCFGALMIGAGLYGLSGAVALRLADTVLGAAFGLCFAALFHRLSRRLLPAADPAL